MEKNWVNFLKNKRDEILEDGKKIFIVNAGRMNHGKSSLFNSLLNKPIFAVDDIRTTMTRQDADFSQDVVMVDLAWMQTAVMTRSLSMHIAVPT